MKLNLEKKFDKYSKEFDFKRIFNPTLTSKLLINSSQNFVKTSKKILDLGCGGGIITRPENVEYLKDHLTIWLDVSPEEAAARLEHSDHRPLLNECKDTIKKLQEILDNRQVGYAEAASLHINTGQRAPDIITHEILEKLESYHV